LEKLGDAPPNLPVTVGDKEPRRPAHEKWAGWSKWICPTPRVLRAEVKSRLTSAGDFCTRWIRHLSASPVQDRRIACNRAALSKNRRSGAEVLLGLAVFSNTSMKWGFATRAEEIVLASAKPSPETPPRGTNGANEGNGGQAIGSFFAHVSAPGPQSQGERDRRERNENRRSARHEGRSSACPTAGGLGLRDIDFGRRGSRPGSRSHAT